MPVPQRAIGMPATSAAIFLVLSVNPAPEDAARAVEVCTGVGDLVRAIAARDPKAGLSAVVAFGSDAWDRLFGAPRPTELHPFRELRAGHRIAPSTPGDVLFHIRADRFDMCFELGARIMSDLGGSVVPIDEAHGFRYFDDRDLTGFVDGTENPSGTDALAATIVGDEDPDFAGGSYIVVQKYLHDLAGWRGLATEAQERIIGRTKLDDIELDAKTKPTFAHNFLTSIEDNGVAQEIFRNNMPFGHVSGELGTYFIAYAKSPEPIERMMANMFLGDPPGNYDHLLDFTKPVTGLNFFAPSQDFLDAATPPAPASPGQAEAVSVEPPPAGRREGMLDIGSLKGVPQS